MHILHVDHDAMKIVLEQFNRTEESFKEDVMIVKEWMKTQKHLPEIMDEVKIGNFLLLNKCSIETAKQKIDMYYTIRSLIPDFFDNMNPKLPHLKEYRKEISFIIPFPVLLDKQYRLIFMKPRACNKHHPRSELLQIFNIQEIRLCEDRMIGEIFICDMVNVSLNDVLKWSPSLITKAAAVYKNVYSTRVKAVHIVNSKPYITHVLSVLRTLIKPKIFDRITCHENSDCLKEIFPTTMLPKDYGGDGPTLNELNELLDAQFEEYKDTFDRLEKLRVHENLRPKRLNNDEVLGFYGNFRKLDVD